MHHLFGAVLWIVCGVGVIVGVLALIGSGRTWEEFGKRGLVMDRETDAANGWGGSRGAGGSAAGGGPGGFPSADAERDEEIRQMLEARNARRARRGEAVVDVEDELRRLTAPRIDDALRSEIRDLVIARNHRRERRGQPPLDVDAEVEREIERLGSL